MFEIEFVDLKGNTRRKIVPNHRIAREVARSLAIAIGRRAIIRKRNTKWTFLLIDLETRAIVQVGKGYSKEDANEFWNDWDYIGNNSVAIAWPEELEIPI